MTTPIDTIDCTTMNEPVANAAAWRMNPTTSPALPASHRGSRSRRRINLIAPVPAVGTAEAERCCTTVATANTAAAAMERKIDTIDGFSCPRRLRRP